MLIVMLQCHHRCARPRVMGRQRTEHAPDAARDRRNMSDAALDHLPLRRLPRAFRNRKEPARPPCGANRIAATSAQPPGRLSANPSRIRFAPRRASGSSCAPSDGATSTRVGGQEVSPVTAAPCRSAPVTVPCDRGVASAGGNHTALGEIGKPLGRQPAGPERFLRVPADGSHSVVFRALVGGHVQHRPRHEH